MDGYKEAKKLEKKYGVTVIPGIEIDTNEKGQIVGYGIKKEIKPYRSAKEIIKDIHKQGGLAVIPHPFDFTRGMKNIEEISDLVDGIEILNYGAFFNKRAKKYAKKNGFKIKTGGSDAHHRFLIGAVLTGFPDTCKTARDYLECLKKGDFEIRKGKNYYIALLLGLLNIIYTRTVGKRKYRKWAPEAATTSQTI
jgi:predicted metal-dependent phosphoesterase TrpH